MEAIFLLSTPAKATTEVLNEVATERMLGLLMNSW
jgi:hypothetical protein